MDLSNWPEVSRFRCEMTSSGQQSSWPHPLPCCSEGGMWAAHHSLCGCTCKPECCWKHHPGRWESQEAQPSSCSIRSSDLSLLLYNLPLWHQALTVLVLTKGILRSDLNSESVNARCTIIYLTNSSFCSSLVKLPCPFQLIPDSNLLNSEFLPSLCCTAFTSHMQCTGAHALLLLRRSGEQQRNLSLSNISTLK